jgi:hypothetical protein
MANVAHQRVVVKELSNVDFFERYAAAGRVGLVGGPHFIEKAIRRAQRKQREDRSHSRYGHAFVFQGKRADGRHWVLESDIDIHRERAQIGVQENRVSKYADDAAYPFIAVLDFGLTPDQAQGVLAEGLELLHARTQYSLREILATYLRLRTPEDRDRSSRLHRDRAMFCSAFVQHLYAKIGIDFAPDVHTKLTTPEDIAQTKLPHSAFLLERVASSP